MHTIVRESPSSPGRWPNTLTWVPNDFYEDLTTQTHEIAKITEATYWFFIVVKIAAIELLGVCIAKMYDLKHSLDAKSSRVVAGGCMVYIFAEGRIN